MRALGAESSRSERSRDGAAPIPDPVPSRFTAPGRSAGFWVAMWTLAVAAEFGALVPIIFGDAPVEGADVVYRLVGGSFAAFGLSRGIAGRTAAAAR